MANPYCGAAVQPAEPLYIGPNTHRLASLGQRHTLVRRTSLDDMQPSAHKSVKVCQNMGLEH